MDRERNARFQSPELRSRKALHRLEVAEAAEVAWMIAGAAPGKGRVAIAAERIAVARVEAEIRVIPFVTH